jgi:hypothetical protein
MSGARDDIPRERFYNPGANDPIRGNTPWAPVTGNASAAPQVPVVGLLVLAGVVLVFEHFRKGR